MQESSCVINFLGGRGINTNWFPSWQLEQMYQINQRLPLVSLLSRQNELQLKHTSFQNLLNRKFQLSSTLGTLYALYGLMQMQYEDANCLKDWISLEVSPSLRVTWLVGCVKEEECSTKVEPPTYFSHLSPFPFDVQVPQEMLKFID